MSDRVAQTVDKMTRDEAKILAHYGAGETTKEIVAKTGSSIGDIELTIDTLASSNRNLARNLTAEWQRRARVAASVPTAKPPAPAPRPTPAAPPAQDSIADMLTAAADTGQPRLVKAADRISDLVAELEEQLAAYLAQEALRTEAAKLEARLAAIRAELGAGAKAPTSAVDSKAIRAWARANNVDCPALGRVPARVLEAYQAASGTARQPSGGDHG